MTHFNFVEEQIHFPVNEAKTPLFLGMNFGGRYLKLGILDNHGRTVSFFAAPTRVEAGPEESTKHAAAMIREALKKTGVELSAIAAAGFSFPGSMNPKTETLHRPPNVPEWEGYPITNKLAEFTGLSSVLFCNNANAAAYGEYWVGAAKGMHSVALLLLDRGIGCGIIAEGREIKGANGYGGEFGHMVVDPSPGARWCNCMHSGHLEAYASATAVARITREMIEVGLKSTLQQRINKDMPLDVIPRMVYEEADKGDELAISIVLDTAKSIGLGVVTLIHTVDPESVLIGGEMMFGGKGSKVGEMFLARIREEVDKRALNYLAENLKLNFAQLGSFGSYIGAAGLAREDKMLLSLSSDE